MIKINIDILLRYGVTYSTQIRLYSERGVKVGNDQMEKLYIKYHRELYLYAFSLCKNHHQAQDLTSDTFFKAYLSLKNVDYIKYWLFRVCKNLYLDSRRNNREYSVDQVIENKLTDYATPLHKLVELEENRTLYHRMLNLNESYREILILYYFCDFSLREIGESNKTTEGAAKTMLFRARKKLKKELEGEHGL